MRLYGFTVTLSTERDLVVLTLFCGGLVLWSRVLRIEGWRVTLSTDQDLVVLSAVQWRFGPGFHGYMVLWIPLWIFKDNYNCNGNNNGNSNDGETL